MRNKKSLPIITFGNEILRKKCQSVEKIDENVKNLVSSMIETMYNNNGVGLAAPQIGENLRIFIIDVSSKKNELQVFINPEIKKLEGSQIGEEGCLSVPEIYAEIPRAEFVEVSAQNLEGESFTLSAEGLLAVAIQHENDHLDGKLFIDYLDKLDILRFKKKLEKIKCKAS